MEMIMNNRALPVIAMLACLAPFAAAQSKSFTATGFNAVDVEGGIQVVFTPEATHSVTVEQTDNDFSDIDVGVKANTLFIVRPSVKKRAWWRGQSMSTTEKDGKFIIKVNGKVVPTYLVRVSGPGVARLAAASSSMITATNLAAGALTLDASSSGSIKASGAAATTVIDASSSAKIDASGLTTNGLTLDASTSSSVRAMSVGTATVKLDVSTSSDVDVTARGASAVDAVVSTSAVLTLAGTCGAATLDASTSSELIAERLVCRKVDATSDTSASIDAHAIDSVFARASTSGSIDISGKPAVRDVEESTSGDISFIG
jgi:Putative auto-transporter adhesin, head GIN domain